MKHVQVVAADFECMGRIFTQHHLLLLQRSARTNKNETKGWFEALILMLCHVIKWAGYLVGMPTVAFMLATHSI